MFNLIMKWYIKYRYTSSLEIKGLFSDDIKKIIGVQIVLTEQERYVSLVMF